MGKQHDTFPGEPAEAPVPSQQPEIRQPADPREPELPREAPDHQPEEFPDQPGRPDTKAMPDSVAADLKSRSK